MIASLFIDVQITCIVALVVQFVNMLCPEEQKGGGRLWQPPL